MTSTSARTVAVEPCQSNVQSTGGTFFGFARRALAPVDRGRRDPIAGVANDVRAHAAGHR